MKFLIRSAALLVLSLSAINSALAERAAVNVSSSALHALREQINKPAVQAVHSAQSVPARYEALAIPLRVSGSAAKLGRFRVNLPTRKLFSSSKGLEGSAFLQGRARSSRSGGDQSLVSFATVTFRSAGLLKIRAFLPAQARRSKKVRLAEVSILARETSAGLKISRVSVSQSKREMAPHLACINDQKSSLPHTAQAVGTQSLYTVARMLLEVDNEYANLVPDYQVEMATVANGTDAMYRADLNIAIDTTLTAEPQQYDTPIILDESFAFPIHEEMAVQQPPSTRNADLHYLLSGKVPVGEDIQFLLGAVPDLGTICRAPELSVGFTIRTNTSEDILTTAHEAGHLFGGEHDDNFTTVTTRGVMHSGTTDIANIITNFSDYSKSQIAGFVNTIATCLTKEEREDGDGGGPEIQYTVLPFKLGAFFAAEITDESGEPAASVTVTFHRSKTKNGVYKAIRSGITDADGLISFRPRKIGFYKFSVGSIESRPLRLRRRITLEP